MTEVTVVKIRAVVAAIEAQTTGVVGEGRIRSVRPIVTVLTYVVGVRTVAIASSRKEDAVPVRTDNGITMMAVPVCPYPFAFRTKFI